MKHRKLRIAWSVAWGLVAVLLSALWVRSYSHIDGAYFQLFTTPTFGFISGPGRVVIGAERRGRSGTDGAIFSNSFHEHPALEESFKSQQSPSGFNAVFSRTLWTIEVPHYFAVAIIAVTAVLPWLRWRFSLRTLLIATTLVAVALGLIAWLS